jgi:hypothetical protein
MLLVRLATLWFAVAVGFAALFALRAKYPRLGAGGAGAESDATNNANAAG